MGWLRSLAISAISNEGIESAKRFRRRQDLFARAQRRAMELSRPLLVIGDPDTGAHTSLARAYGCGHVCVDMTGCPKCPNGIPVVLGEQSIPLESDHYVVYAACTLELVDKLPAAWAEILRVAGSRENVFIVCIGPWTLTAFVYPGVKWRIFSGPPDSQPLVAQRIRPRGPRLSL